MLYEIATGNLITIPDWIEEEMRQDFPEFFKGKPLTIKAKKEKMVTTYKVVSNNHDSAPRPYSEAPKGTPRNARGYILDPENGDRIHIQYTSSPVVNNQGRMDFTKAGGYVKVTHGMIVKPGDKDLLFYLHYLYPNLDGNRCIEKRSNVTYEYSRPAVEAKVRIDKARQERELESTIYFETPYDVIKKTMVGLGMNLTDSEEQNRVILFDAIKKGSETFKRNAFELLGPKKAETKQVSVESVHELVNRLLSENFIKNEDGLWYIRDRRGDGTKWLKSPFFESTQTGSEAAFALIDHLKVNEELLGKLRKL